MAWNYKGTSSLTALRHFSLLIKTNQSDILILVKTQYTNDVSDKIMNKMQFNFFVVVEVMGFSDHIWTL